MNKKLAVSLICILCAAVIAVSVFFYMDHRDNTRQIIDLQTNVVRLEEELKNKNAQILSLQQENEALNGQITTLNQDIALLNAQIEDQLQEIARKAEEIAALQAENAALKESEQALTDQIAQLEEEIALLKADLAEKEVQIAQLNEELARLNASIVKPDSAPSPQNTPAPTPRPTATPYPFPTLRRGQAGDDVKLLQEMLAKADYYAGEINGIFNEETEKAVRAFQRDHHLIVDGVASPDMQHLLLTEAYLP